MEESSQRLPEAASAFHLADTLYRQGRYQDALSLLDGVDREFPRTRNVMYARALCLAGLGRKNEAVELCDALLERFAEPRAVELKAVIAGSDADTLKNGSRRAVSGRAKDRPVRFLFVRAFRLKYIIAVAGAVAVLLSPLMIPAIRGGTGMSQTNSSVEKPAVTAVGSKGTSWVVPSTAPGSTDDPYTDQILQAADLCKSGHWSQSVAVASSVLQARPDHAGALDVQQRVNEARRNFLNSHDSIGGNTHVVCLNNPGQSYELYAPPGCPPEQSQILYAFSPSGNGKEMLPWMAPVAARLRWIVAVSNNSKNGPWEPILEAQDAVFRDTAERLDLHPTLRFATGFSGGARAALALAFRYPGGISGVLAMGAGWPVNTKLRPLSRQLNVYILIGRSDSNITYDIPRTEKKLRAAGVNCATAVYEGGHLKPPQEMIQAACDWLRRCALSSMGYTPDGMD
jgi:predicted esterase